MGKRALVRIVGYLLTVVVAASVFVAGGVITWRKRNAWEKEARRVQVDSVQFAHEYRTGLREMSLALVRYRLSHDSAEHARFGELANGMSNRLATLDQKAFVPESREILRQLTEEFARFRKRAEGLFDDNLALTTRDLLTQLDRAVERGMVLDARLTAIQRDVLDSMVSRVRLDMDRVWDVLYAGMCLLLISGTALALVAYRDWVAPLRRAVVQSRAVLQQQEKLSALGLLTAGLAHEIRNPLNSIKARLFTQRRVLGAQSSGLEDNQCIEEEVDRLEGIVDTALQFARPAAPCFETIRLQGALETWCGLLEASLRQSDIQLRFDFRTDPEIKADLNQLKQALLNLIKNAAESIGKKGTVTLRTVPTLLRHGGRRPALAIEVEDTGPGVPPEARKRLFDPFFTTKENGTGLGLSISARIAHSHGGLIECEAAPRSGALFRIIVPLASGGGTSRPTREMPDSGFNRRIVGRDVPPPTQATSDPQPYSAS